MYEKLIPFFKEWFKEAETYGFSIPKEYGQVPGQESDHIHFEKTFGEFIQRMKGNYPFHSPQYAGQMLKPPHPYAWFAYSLAMTINPNNHALDGGPPSSEMEKEVMQELAEMVGYNNHFLGHLTSGGTVANLEALWVAKCLHPKKKILYSSDAHYTHKRMADVLGIESASVPVDDFGKIDVIKLEEVLPGAGTLVVTMGTTGRGVVDKLDKIVPMCKSHGVRIHVDAAYGGFFKIIEDNFQNSAPWKSLSVADSIVIDPHKHGLQPYGCGSVLFKDPEVGRFYKHDSPYTYFTSDNLHLGEITLECSRPGASAAALWFTIKTLGLTPESPFGNMLKDCIQAAGKFAEEIDQSEYYSLIQQPELDIVCYFPVATSTSEITRLAKRIFDYGMKESQEPFFLSLYKMPSTVITKKHSQINADQTEVTVLRSVFMKPSHKEYVKKLIIQLETACVDYRE